MNYKDRINLYDRSIRDGHLGGHCDKTWIDKGVLKWAKYNFDIQSILDIGCGPGGMIRICEDLDIHWYGIDGDPNLKIDHPNFILRDFCKSNVEKENSKAFSLGWSVEFLEHVDEQYQAEYMKCFEMCEYVIATAAPPGFGGHHHVNEQPLSYWVEVFMSYGLLYSAQLTKEMKKYSTMSKKIRLHDSFMGVNGMFFISENK